MRRDFFAIVAAAGDLIAALLIYIVLGVSSRHCAGNTAYYSFPLSVTLRAALTSPSRQHTRRVFPAIVSATGDLITALLIYTVRGVSPAVVLVIPYCIASHCLSL